MRKVWYRSDVSAVTRQPFPSLALPFPSLCSSGWCAAPKPARVGGKGTRRSPRRVVRAMSARSARRGKPGRSAGGGGADGGRGRPMSGEGVAGAQGSGGGSLALNRLGYRGVTAVSQAGKG